MKVSPSGDKAQELYDAAQARGIDPSNVILFDDQHTNLEDVETLNSRYGVSMQYACSGPDCVRRGYPHSATGFLNGEWVSRNMARMPNA